MHDRQAEGIGAAQSSSVQFTVVPKAGATARAISATYSTTYLASIGAVDAGANRITLPVFGLYPAHSNQVRIVVKRGKASVLGAPFVKEDYGIAFPRNETKVLKRPDTLRNKVDTTLLKMREDGSYQRIHDKWFGKK